MTDVNIHNETKKEKIPLSDSGELIFILTVPVCEEILQINDFYAKVQELCYAFCTQKLPALLPSQKSVYRYRLSSKLCSEGEDVTVILTITLSDLTERRQLIKHLETHLWRDGVLRKRTKA